MITTEVRFAKCGLDYVTLAAALKRIHDSAAADTATAISEKRQGIDISDPDFQTVAALCALGRYTRDLAEIRCRADSDDQVPTLVAMNRVMAKVDPALEGKINGRELRCEFEPGNHDSGLD
jgi:hypothetical protein